MGELLRIEKICKAVRFGADLTTQILRRESVGFRGSLYSPEYEKWLKTDHSTAKIEACTQAAVDDRRDQYFPLAQAKMRGAIPTSTGQRTTTAKYRQGDEVVKPMIIVWQLTSIVTAMHLIHI